jgi:translation initiation factor 2 subunit 2
MADTEPAFDFGSKKKKKPTKSKESELVDEKTLAPTDDKNEIAEGTEAVVLGKSDADELTELFSKSQKKKPKVKPAPELKESGALSSETVRSPGDADGKESAERDYNYEDLLRRAFELMRERNPELVDASGGAHRVVMKPPELSRIGTKKTCFVNFGEICTLMRRTQKHVLAFMMSELGTTASLDANSQLIIKGRFQIKQIENVLRNYIKEYVLCKTCKSQSTTLAKDTRLFFLQCDKCGSRCVVQSIKSGYQALTSKRAQLRAKTG